jgi:drug/metabolite transporter (DMT)-like permease
LAVPALFETTAWREVTSVGWAGIGWLGTLPVVVAYAAWFRALKLVPASTAATATLLVPVIGVFASALWLGEPLGVRQLLALAMTVGGVALAARA